MRKFIIKEIRAREVLDSRGFLTLEVETYLENGSWGRFITPAGMSKGKFEAVSIYDSNKRKTLQTAIENTNKIGLKLKDCPITDQKHLDKLLIELDGTKNKSNIGANVLLGISVSFAKAAAACCAIPLYDYISSMYESIPSMPRPFVNIINGGAHSSNNLAFQEFMIVPSVDINFKEGMLRICDVFKALKVVLKRKNYSLSVGDEGGFAPDITSENEALDLIALAVKESGYILGQDIFIALDVAANYFYKNNYYILNQKHIDKAQLVNHYAWLMKQYPIISIEDPIAEEDAEGWQIMTNALGSIVQIVGDDVFVTNSSILQKGIERNIANAILIKPNQIGTLTETCETARLAMTNNYKIMVSHRSGETEDTAIAHIAVGLGSKQIKAGSVCRSERTAKYNELLRIAERLDSGS